MADSFFAQLGANGAPLPSLANGTGQVGVYLPSRTVDCKCVGGRAALYFVTRIPPVLNVEQHERHRRQHAARGQRERTE